MADTRLDAGDTAPTFTLTDQDGASVSLGDFAGQKVILYFYPAADTPGCTTQACDFRDNLSSLKSAGYQVLGVSRDEVDALKKFQKKRDVNFPFLSDPDLTVHNAYGAWGEKSMYGKKMTGVLRSTFVIDENGKIELPALQREGDRPRGLAAQEARSRQLKSYPQIWVFLFRTYIRMWENVEYDQSRRNPADDSHRCRAPRRFRSLDRSVGG